MGFLWPTKIKAEPSIFGRFGRVVHWLFTALSIGCAAILIGALINDQDLSIAGAILVAGIVMFFSGRAARYVFSGE